MKKVMLFMTNSSFVLLLLIIAVGCSGDSDEPKESPIETETRHIDGSIITVAGDMSNYDALYDFFNKELPIMSVSRQSDTFRFDNLSDTCYLVNSYDELQSIYVGKKQLPAIDFDSYTLIVGQKCSNNMYDTLDKQSFYEKDGNYFLDLFFTSEIVHPMVVYYNYWGLYPKVSKKEIYINIILNK